MTTGGANPVEAVLPLPEDVLAVCTALLSPAGWLPVHGHPSLLLRSNTALLSALRCTLTGSSVTVASVSMTFEEDRPLQLTVWPRDRDAFAAVCDLLSRHAGALDRLDHAACVADLLRYVDRVEIESESSGLVPTVARIASGSGRGQGHIRYEPAPLPVWPPPERSRAALNQRRSAGDGALLAWDPAQYKQLPRLLAKDRRRSLGARVAYYESKGLLRPGDGFVRTIEGGRQAVWFPGNDSQGAFAHSIGLGYLHDLPEILLLSPMPAMIGATSRALALTVNAIADAMIGGGVRLAPGDRYGAIADIVARTVHKECTLDHASLAQSCFVIPSPRIEERTLGVGAWFYANFMDAPSFPVLACLLQPRRVPDGYGVPPPPPPARAKAKARPAAPSAKPRAASTRAKSKASLLSKRKRPAVRKAAAKKAPKRAPKRTPKRAPKKAPKTARKTRGKRR